MPYVIRLTLKKSATARQLTGARHAFLLDHGPRRRARFVVARGNMTHEGTGRLYAAPVPMADATRYETRKEACAALAAYVIATNWEASMWVKNPQIVEA